MGLGFRVYRVQGVKGSEGSGCTFQAYHVVWAEKISGFRAYLFSNYHISVHM